HARPDEIAALATLVRSAAAQDDPLALALMQAGADEITQSLAALGWHDGLDLCLTGGLGGQYHPYLPPALQARITAPAAAPIVGALALASDFARGEIA
ncbi:MAG: ATPase, partial [Paracoccaceae bacterium]